MIIVDVEATGVDPSRHSILSIGAVDFNDPARRFEIECSAFPNAEYEEEALAINGHTKDDIFDSSKPSEAEAIKQFVGWMKESDDHTFAGQNCYFDLEFVRAATHRIHLDVSVPKRIVDLHSVVWSHMIAKGQIPPVDPEHRRSSINSDFVCSYVGIPNEMGSHVGINGALWEAEAFSRLFYDRPLLSEFIQYPIPWL